MTDIIPLIREVLFVGEHFTMMTSVAVDESLREEGEPDDEFYIRLASEGIKEYYGWDVRERSVDIAVVLE
jgi:hypothetical protein